MTTPPWEPPFAGTEAEQLLGALDRMRWTFRWKVDGLDEAGLSATLGGNSPSTLSLGWLLEHLVEVEDSYRTRIAGSPDSPDSPDFSPTDADLLARYDAAVARHRAELSARIADGGLDQLVVVGNAGEEASLRRVVCDLVEEYARHTGHADLLREAVDGLTGEDPPDDWRP